MLTNPFQGLSSFPITPADEHGHVDTETLGQLVARIRDARVDSLCILGSTGVYAYLSRGERRKAIQAAVLHAGDVPVIAGIGALRTDDVLALARDAQDCGAKAMLLAPVSYTPLTDQEVFTLYQTVSGALSVPLCIYNNPATTHFAFSTELLSRLSELPGITGVKNPAPTADGIAADLTALRSKTAAGFSLGYSGDWHAAEALIAGADAWYSVAAGLFPESCLSIVRAAQAGDAEGARALNSRLEPLWALFRELSSIRVMYAAVNCLGLARCAAPLPILPLSDYDKGRVESVLATLKLN